MAHLPVVADYQSAIERAVSELADNTPEARQALYERARAVLASQLSGQGLPKSHIAQEMRLLNEGIWTAENSARISSRSSMLARKGSTTLLFLSYFSIFWLTDVSCMSLYWVARLPKDLWQDA